MTSPHFAVAPASLSASARAVPPVYLQSLHHAIHGAVVGVAELAGQSEQGLAGKANPRPDSHAPVRLRFDQLPHPPLHLRLVSVFPTSPATPPDAPARKRATNVYRGRGFGRRRGSGRTCRSSREEYPCQSPSA